MKFEEKKPEDILMSEREIKQETDDFLKNVKEEPIEEEEYSELVIPKQETGESSEIVKEEPIEEEYSELIIPKFEDAIEPSASHMSYDPMQKSFIGIHRDVPNLYVEPPRKPLQRHRCPVCFQMNNAISMKQVRMKEDKLIIMVGCVLRGSYTLEQAQLFKRERKIMYICYAHFSEAINEIYTVLNIENTNEITSCSSELIDNLMVTVNALYPQIETEQFCDIIPDFVSRNISRKRRRSNPKEELNGKQQKYHCSVCTQKRSSEDIKQVSLKDEELVLMVGCILRGEYTLKKARCFISQINFPLVCHLHFSEALSEIYKALNIKNPDEISSCSIELMNNLMITVNELCPQIGTGQFWTNLYKFFIKNKQFIQLQ